MKAVTDFAKAYREGRRISVVTCYEAWSARLLADTAIDAILVGDSGSMISHGHPSTVYADLDQMVGMTAATRRGLGPERFLIADLPFPLHRQGPARAVEAADALLKAGANAVKLEGVRGHEDTIAHLVGSGVPVMGHLGLTPQSVNLIGGYKVQGREAAAAEQLLADARRLQDLGCFSLVLELIPAALAQQVTEALAIPTIGIGSGVHCSGQVLVLHDLLGLNPGFRPKFLRTYLNGAELIQQALNAYAQDVQAGAYPSEEESFR